MRLDLAERLRCPRAHAPTPLVVVASEVVERELRRGVAGCMTCRYEARFEAGDLIAADAVSFAGSHAESPATATASDGAATERLATLLGLGDPEGAVLLFGAHATHAHALSALTRVVAIVDGVPARATVEDPVAGLVGFGDAVPFSDGTFRGAAVSAGISTSRLAEVVRVTRVGGRVVGPVAIAVPPGLEELARDRQEWVAEVAAARTIVGLSRGGPRGG